MDRQYSGDFWLYLNRITSLILEDYVNCHDHDDEGDDNEKDDHDDHDDDDDYDGGGGGGGILISAHFIQFLFFPQPLCSVFFKPTNINFLRSCL